jgi:hypothetical protein
MEQMPKAVPFWNSQVSIMASNNSELYVCFTFVFRYCSALYCAVMNEIRGVYMSFYKEPTHYEKTALSDLQGAWTILRDTVVEN